MSARQVPILLGVLAATAVALGTTVSYAQEAPAPPDGVEVLPRGPVHEAYAEPGLLPPEPSPVVPKAPPDPVNELPPDQKPEGPNVEWVPGYWAWDSERNDFTWVSGFWRTPPPGRQWVPGHWQQSDAGYQWVPGFWGDPGQPQLNLLPAPPASLEAGPSVPGPSESDVYVPGCWVWQQSRYLWRPGLWVPFRPGWVWVPAHYVWTPAGYVFVEGYWDYPLRQRGLLFAPVCIAPRLLARPGWCWTPQYAVCDDFLLGALFVRPGWGGYWFGDWFGPRYRRAGFVPWVDFRLGRACPDPLFSWYARANAGNRLWANDLRGLYAARSRGEAPLPPRTLVQQNTLIRNITVNRSVTNVNVNHVRAVVPLAQLDQNVVRLESVGREQRLHQQRAAEQVRQVAVQRARTEARLLSEGPRGRPVGSPRSVKLDLPPAGRNVAPVRNVPPPVTTGPVHPRHDAAPVRPAPRKEAPPPPAPRKEAPPSAPQRRNVSPHPPASHPAPPPAVRRADSPPPSPRKAAAPRQEVVSHVARKAASPPPSPRKAAAPPPRHVSPPPAPKHASPPPAPRHQAAPAPKHNAPPPKPPKHKK